MNADDGIALIERICETEKIATIVKVVSIAKICRAVRLGEPVPDPFNNMSRRNRPRLV